MTRSRSLAPVLLAALAASALGLVAWLAFDEPDAAPAVAASDRDRSSALARPDAQAPLAAPLEQPAAALQDAPQTSEDASSSAPTRSAVDETAERELADALWVEGRVEFPPGTPPDEELEVVADGREFEHVGEPKGKHRVRVAADGRFRVAFRKDTKTGLLRIDARYCWLEAPLKLKPASPPDSIVLAPTLGGCIAGSITPPPGAADVDAVRARAGLTSLGWARNEQPQQRAAKVDAQWRYELRGMDPKRQHRVTFDALAWTVFAQDSVRVEAGRRTTLDIACELGATVSGLVVDASGAPVGNAQIQAKTTRGGKPDERGENRHGQSKASGEFVLAGIRAGVVELQIEREGFTAKQVALGALADGQVREGERIELDSGSFVAGVVTWNDGSPAARAMVLIDEPHEGTRYVFGEPQGHRVDAQGRFKITGLGVGPFKVSASAPASSRSQAEEGGEESKAKGSGPKWRAEVRGVLPGAELVLVLTPGASIAGVVVDEHGAPVPKFSVRAVDRGAARGFQAAAPVAASKFETSDGRFVLEGLTDGAWNLIASAKGYSESVPVQLDVPYTGSGITITLARNARLAGVVVDPAGRPLPGAKVELERERSKLHLIAEDVPAKSDEHGRFEVENAPSGLVTLTASHERFAPSLRMELRVAPGEERTDLRLELSEGGTVRGSIHPSELQRAATWSVSLSGKQGGWTNASTDGEGTFLFERVRPGEYRVMAHAAFSERDVGSSKPRAPRMLQGAVTVAAGTTSEIVIGAPSTSAFEIRGRVTLAGNPVDGAAIFVSRKNFSDSSTTNASGDYSVKVDGAGRYTLSANLPSDGASRVVQVDVSEDGPSTQDIAFDDGRMRGRVVDTANEPVAHANVQCLLVRAASKGSSASSSAMVNTDAQGAFELHGLAPGEYRITVRDFGHFGDARFGSLVVEGVALEADRAREDLVLRVEPSAGLRCTVRGADGGPVIGATVDARERSGASFSRSVGARRTDGAGICTVSGLVTGDYIVVARSDDLVGASALVRAVSGESRDAEIVLRRGGYLAITRTAADGAPVTSGKLELRDAAGFDWGLGAAGWRVESDVWTAGPLPTGSYRVAVAAGSGASTAVTAVVSAGDTRAVALQLTSP